MIDACHTDPLLHAAHLEPRVVQIGVFYPFEPLDLSERVLDVAVVEAVVELFANAIVVGGVERLFYCCDVSECVLFDLLEKTSYFVLKVHDRIVSAVDSVEQVDCLLLVLFGEVPVALQYT